LSVELQKFYGDLDKESLRIVRPTQVIFLCGGRTANDGPHTSLRDYLLRAKRIRRKFSVVLAETANDLYRDTQYPDLISFEEDIALIAALVVVIAESPGSLAELGAFASSPLAGGALRIMMQQEFFKQNSFIRHGPVERIRSTRRERVGVYPWKTHSSGLLNTASVRPHAAKMIEFLDREVQLVPDTSRFDDIGAAKVFFVIYWVIYLSLAISIPMLSKLVIELMPELNEDDVINKLFCMRLVGWIEQESYDDSDYVFALVDRDPFDYSFSSSAQSNDSLRRKAVLQSQMGRADNVPDHVKRLAIASRRPR
jgi:hypothetical protein